MIFRIENSESLDDSVHRTYQLEDKDLPIINKNELDNFIADEIRKEVNGSKARRVLSYSKSLGVCLLKYNESTVDEIHINNEIDLDVGSSVEYFNYNTKKREWKWDLVSYDLKDVITLYDYKQSNTEFESEKNQEATKIKIFNFAIDVSNNILLDKYLRLFTKTATGMKRFVSPEKDKEFILFQSPDDYVIKTFKDSVFLLYALVIKYGMKRRIRNDIIDFIYEMDDQSFSSYDESNEREGLILLIEYLYENIDKEREMVEKIIEESKNSNYKYKSFCYFSSISQFHYIQQNSFEEAYGLSDYNWNKLSEHIWEIYAQYYL